MIRTVIENTDIRVSRIAFGTASLHHVFSSSQRQRLLATAVSVGITHFDTSPYYGYGLAESDLGIFLRRQRPQLTLATKIGLYTRSGASSYATAVWGRKALGHLIPSISLPVVNWKISRAQKSLSESLKRLNTDWVDFLHLHEPDIGAIQTDEFLRWIEDEHARGRVRSWGLAGTADRILPWLERGHGLARVVQTQDSLDLKQADFMGHFDRDLQFTYGYFTPRQGQSKKPEADAVLRMALRRNSKGAVIFSTRQVERLTQVAKLF